MPTRWTAEAKTWADEYDRRIADGAPTRVAGDLGNVQVQDDRGRWFHRAPGSLDCPCGRDERGRRVDPYINTATAAGANDGEMRGGHFIPFWQLEREAEEAERAVPVEPLQFPDRHQPAAPSRSGRVA